MKKLVLKDALYIVCGAVSGLITPSLLLFAFNFTDGIQNNPDGELFVPFGIVALLVVLLIDIWIILRITLPKSTSKRHKILMLLLFLLAKVHSAAANGRWCGDQRPPCGLKTAG